MSNTVLSSWERRGHERKPNAIVRGIYATLDWIGDFGYLTKSMKQETGYFVTTMVGTLITLSILISSTIHSIELLEHAGLHSGLQYVMLLPFEVLFLASSNALNKSIAQGKYFPLWPCAGFIVSLIFVWRSNILGLADNMDGQVLAWLTPFLLLISKGLLAWNVKHRKAVSVNQQSEEKAAKTMVKTDVVSTKENDQNMGLAMESALVKNTTDQPEILPEVTIETVNNVDKTEEPMEVIAEEKTPSQADKEKLDETSGFEEKLTKELPSEQKQEAEQPNDQTKDIADAVVKTVDADPSKVTDILSMEVVKNRPEKPIEDLKELTEIIAKKIPAKSRERKKTIEKTTRMALRFYTQKGKTPTRDELIAKANCSQNIAKDVLKEIKQLDMKVS